MGETSIADFRGAAVRTLDRLPVLAGGTAKLLGKLGRRDVEVSELSNIVQSDPLLAGRVLQLANSAAFGRLRTIQTIKHAVALLGPSVLRRHALSWTIGNFFKRFQTAPGWPAARFTLHSDATALLADSLSENLPVRDPEAAYVAGLIHDIGKVVISTAAPDIAERISVLHRLGGTPVIELERELLGIDHAEISSMAAHRWGLSESICDAVHFHHAPPDSGETTGSLLSLSTVLARADEFVNARGWGIIPEENEEVAPPVFPGHEKATQESVAAFEVAWRLASGMPHE